MLTRYRFAVGKSNLEMFEGSERVSKVYLKRDR